NPRPYGNRYREAPSLLGFMSVKHSIVRLGLEWLYFSGAHVLLRPLVGAVGAILMLHHVRPPRRDRFHSNKQLAVTPEFLSRVIRRLQCMDWREIGELARNPQVTIGAHTVNHPMLAKASEGAVRTELKMSRAVIAAALGKAPDHLAYPYGDPTTAG